MFETIVGLFLTAALFYAAFGFVFAIPFVLYWSGRIDSAAKSGSWGFRLAILPGTIALWPLMALKTLQTFRHGAFARSSVFGPGTSWIRAIASACKAPAPLR